MTDYTRGEQSEFGGVAAFAQIHLSLCSINS